ncbi:MAG: hypothetical protein COB10_12070 [Planctomycetota bacterium]|nr:MAG: hypothetical protein COB10_12070 [Planctomycetota bacterium]
MNLSSGKAELDGIAVTVAQSCVVCSRKEIEWLLPKVPWTRSIEASSDLMLHIVELLTSMGKVEAVESELLC